MKSLFCALVETIVDLFSAWLSVGVDNRVWCPVKVDTRDERY